MSVMNTEPPKIFMSRHPVSPEAMPEARPRRAGTSELRPVPDPVSLPVPDEYPCLREEVVAKLWRLGGEKLVGQLIELFEAGAPGRIAAILSAVAAGDGPTVEREAHALKSSAGNLGAMRMWALCQQLESRASVGELSRTAALAHQLESEFGRVSPRLRGCLKGE